MNRKFSTEVGIGIFICLLVIVVSISGIITYQNLTSLTTDLKKGTIPNKEIMILNQIATDLYETESNVRTYYFSRDSSYLDDYVSSRTRVENRISSLQPYTSTSIAKFRMDSIRYLVDAKFAILDEWISMEVDEKVTSQLSSISRKLKPEKEELPPNLPKTKRRDKKAKKEEEKVGVDFTLIEVEVKKAQQRQTAQLRKLNQQELLLNTRNKVINDAFRNIITQIEKEEKASISGNNAEAIRKANLTNFIIGVFCCSSVFLLILMGATLFRYISKTTDYNKALKNARLEAENLAMAKQNFLANMTHEIRTPINAIIGFTEQLDKTALNDSQKEHLQIIKKSSVHLLKIVNDVLDYSKLQAGKFSFEKTIFSPIDTIQEVIDILLPEAEEKNITVTYEKDKNLPAFLLGDPFRLQQILLNVIGNAIKFTGSGNIYVVVKMEDGIEQEKLLKMEIKDTGIGIPAYKIDQVFNDFEQGDTNVSRKFKGTGLGLSITKKLVEYQKGNIHILSTEGAGTVVDIVIPYEVVTHHSEEKTAENKIDSTFLRNKRVLIVDDETFNRKLLRTILAQWGANVDEAHDGENALFLVDNKSYELILMDVRMPGITGIEITQKIRTHEKPEKRNIAIIALTASNEKEKEKKCMDAGMNAFLPKPFTESRLFELISKVMSGLTPVNNNGVKLASLDELNRLGNGDKEFVKEMARLFIKGAQEGLKTIQEAYVVNDWQAIQEMAHKIAPSCRHLGAIRMLDLIKLIEKQANSQANKADMGVLIRELEIESSATIEEVQKQMV